MTPDPAHRGRLSVSFWALGALIGVAVFAATAAETWLLPGDLVGISPVLVFGGLGVLALGLEDRLGRRDDIDAGPRPPFLTPVGIVTASLGLSFAGRTGLGLLLSALGAVLAVQMRVN